MGRASGLQVEVPLVGLVSGPDLCLLKRKGRQQLAGGPV